MPNILKDKKAVITQLNLITTLAKINRIIFTKISSKNFHQNRLRFKINLSYQIHVYEEIISFKLRILKNKLILFNY